MKRLAIFAAGMLLVTTMAACGDDTDTGLGSDDGGASEGGAQQFTVQVDGESKDFNGEFAAFFPSALKAHPGDEVTFKLPRFSGVPHTVTFGTLVDQAMAKFRQLPPTSTIAATENFSEMMKLTDVFPHEAPKGPPSPNQSAAQPCFLESGDPPGSQTGGAPACPKVDQPAFTGAHSFFNSGVLNEAGDEFSMTVADDAQPGDYSFLCLIHRGGMSGVLTVEEEGTAVPSPDEVSEQGESELAKLAEVGKKALAEADKATPDKAVAGTGDPSAPSLIVAEFRPKEISIPVGGSVTWNMFAFHTISLNAKDSDIGILSEAPDGSWSFLPSGAPSGFEVPPGVGDFPPADNEKPVLIDGGKWDGSGSRSTGIIGSLPPRFVSVKQAFTKAGTYTLRCLVHPDMKGTVKVG